MAADTANGNGNGEGGPPAQGSVHPKGEAAVSAAAGSGGGRAVDEGWALTGAGGDVTAGVVAAVASGEGWHVASG